MAFIQVYLNIEDIGYKGDGVLIIKGDSYYVNAVEEE